MMSQNRKIGMMLTGFGGVFLVLGMLLLFDSALLALGNVLFLAGITMLIGVSNTVKFFARRSKLRASACFLGGILLVLVGWPVVGMAVELFGALNLFANFFPLVFSVLRSMPIIGPLLNLGPVRRLTDRLGMGSLLPTSSRPRP